MKYDFQDVKERIAELSEFIVQAQKNMNSDSTIRISLSTRFTEILLKPVWRKNGNTLACGTTSPTAAWPYSAWWLISVLAFSRAIN